MTDNLDLEAYEALAEEGLRTGYATRADEAIRDLVAEVRRLRDALDRQGVETMPPEYRVVVGASVVFTSPDRAAAERYMYNAMKDGVKSRLEVVTSMEGSEI